MKFDENMDGNKQTVSIDPTEYEIEEGNKIQLDARNIQKGISKVDLIIKDAKQPDGKVILNQLLSKIGISNLEFHDEDFYKKNGVKFDKFKKILIKADLEQSVGLLAALCWQVKHTEERLLPREKVHKKIKQEQYEFHKKKISDANILNMLLSNKNLKLQISDIYQAVDITEEQILDFIRDIFDSRTFGTNSPQTKELKQIALDEIISKGNPITIRKGAPPKNQYLGTLAEVILCIIKFEQYSENVKKYNSLEIQEKMKSIDPRKSVKISNSDCINIHDILVFWELMDDKSNNTVNTVTPVDYVKGLIKNIRMQRPDFYAPGSGKAFTSDSYLF